MNEWDNSDVVDLVDTDEPSSSPHTSLAQQSPEVIDLDASESNQPSPSAPPSSAAFGIRSMFSNEDINQPSTTPTTQNQEVIVLEDSDEEDDQEIVRLVAERRRLENNPSSSAAPPLNSILEQAIRREMLQAGVQPLTTSPTTHTHSPNNGISIVQDHTTPTVHTPVTQRARISINQLTHGMNGTPTPYQDLSPQISSRPSTLPGSSLQHNPRQHFAQELENLELLLSPSAQPRPNIEPTALTPSQIFERDMNRVMEEMGQSSSSGQPSSAGLAYASSSSQAGPSRPVHDIDPEVTVVGTWHQSPSSGTRRFVGVDEEGNINHNLLDSDDHEFIRTSLYDGDGEAAARSAAKSEADMSRSQIQALCDLNNLSSDATQELPTPIEMSVSLLKHQRQALAWMVNCEKEDRPPKAPRGGILADDQGFGKTLSTIALLLTNRPEKKPGQKTEPRWGNLIVVPVCIMRQWASEFESRIEKAYRPKVLIYHGHDRTKDPHVLASYDVVVTSYNTLKNEFPKVISYDDKKKPLERRPKGAIYKLKWFRIILDEAQAIKNHRADTFKAVIELQTDRRWSLTGTPIQNTVDDIYSQFIWLRYIIVDSYKEWKDQYKKPLEGRRSGSGGWHFSKRAFEQFQFKLGVVLLRRAKHDKIDGRPVLRLPERNVRIEELEFTRSERAYYHAQERRAIQDLARFGIDPKFTAALTILLRLRQACGHPALCDWNKQKRFHFTNEELDIVDARMLTRCLFRMLPVNVQNRLAIELGPGTEVTQTCPVCMEPIEADDGIVTKCGHIFCRSDFEAWTNDHDTCPTCRTSVGREEDKMNLSGVRQEVHAIARAKERASNAKAEPSNAKNEPRSLKIDLGMDAKEEPVEEGSVSGRPSKRPRLTESKQEDVIEASPEIEAQGQDQEADESDPALKDKKTSAKITYFINEYKKILETTDDKVLCFSQWTRMLDLVEEQLEEQNLTHVRLDGTMNPKKRAIAIRSFETRPECRLFLISLSAGSTGLNLTVANRVFLLDSWWNPAVEDQAIDRVHRIGQMKPVEVVRLKIKGTVEDRILELQERKRSIAQGALGVEGLKTMGRQRLTLRDVMSLFQDVAENVHNRAMNSDDADLVELAGTVMAQSQAI